MPRTARLTVQKWGNSLAVRIPAAVARSARFTAGLPVELVVESTGLLVKPAGNPRLSLAQKLGRFQPSLHGGEAMDGAPMGLESILMAGAAGEAASAANGAGSGACACV